MDKRFILVVLGVLIVGCDGHLDGITDSPAQPTPSADRGTVNLVIESIGGTTVEKYKVNDVTAYDLLAFKHDVKMTYGNYLECIDDVCANKEYVWTFYINDAESPLGVKQYNVKDGDRIEFKFNRGGQRK